MYEHHKERLLPRHRFVGRVAGHLVVALVIIAVAFMVGIVGYHVLGHLSWLDALLNAAMILGGMGPVDPLRSGGAKVFAATYALFSGLVFIGVLGIVLAPFVHRLMHKFHLETARQDD